jgi:hypothetical protein
MVTIKFDGTLEDLKFMIDKFVKIFGGISLYSEDLEIIENIIIPQFEKNFYLYSDIYFDRIILKNTSVNFLLPYNYYLLHGSKKSKSLYNWEYTVILLYIILFFVIMMIIIFIYSYIIEIDIFDFFYKNICSFI